MNLDRSVTSLPGFLSPVAAVKAISNAMYQWSARRAQRQALARLDPHLLDDIGLDPAHARDEALKHFWLE